MPYPTIVAIDGTSGAGKSTTARLAARALGFLYIDTGAMYRAMTYKIIKNKVHNLCDTKALARIIKNTRIEFANRKRDKKIYLDGQDVSKAIRALAIDSLVSQVSALPIVRQKLVYEQRRIARQAKNGVICEGRDIGSVVFPKANLKFFLDCAIDERVNRRYKELKEKGLKVSKKRIRENLLERDYIDSTRAHSPLKKTQDAILLDTTNLTIDEEANFVVNLVKGKIKN